MLDKADIPLLIRPEKKTKMVEAAGIEPASERPSPTTSTRLASVYFRLHPSPETGEYKRLSLSPHWSLKAREKRPASLIGSLTLPAQTVPEGNGDANGY